MGLSIWHLIILLVIALLFFGPSRIEGIGKSMGKAIKGFKDGLDGKDSEAGEATPRLSGQKPDQLDVKVVQAEVVSDEKKDKT